MLVCNVLRLMDHISESMISPDYFISVLIFENEKRVCFRLFSFSSSIISHANTLYKIFVSVVESSHYENVLINLAAYLIF